MTYYTSTDPLVIEYRPRTAADYMSCTEPPVEMNTVNRCASLWDIQSNRITYQLL